MKYVVVFITAVSLPQAKKIADGLLSKRLAACVNIIKGVDSHFIWKGKVEQAEEILLIAKTKHSGFKKLAEEVKKLHSYETPEIIAIPIIAANQEYLKWIEESVK